MRKLGLALVAALSLVACGDDDNNNTGNGSGSAVTPTANGVFPAQGFIGRTVRVEVTGDATNWTSSATLSFGAGVTVSNVTAASPTDLFADIQIGKDATPGMQDVTVTDGAGTYTLAKAFEIDSPATVATLGTMAQGSIVEFQVTSTDIANPFDTTSTTDPFTGAVTYTNIAFSGPAGVSYLVEQVQSYSIVGFMLIDVDASAGGPFAVESGPSGGNVVESASGSITIASRTATALTAGTAANASYANVFDSQLYTFTPGAAPDATELTIAATDANAQADVVILPASGHFADWDGFLHPSPSPAVYSTQGAQQYYIYWDNSGEKGYTYTIEETDVALTNTTALSATNSSVATAAALTLPAFGSNGNGNGGNSTQWVKFTIAAGDVGKKIHVMNGGNAYMIFTVYPSAADATAGTNALDSGGELDYTSPAITKAGTYYISLVEDAANSAADDYTLAVYLE
jgi:hypothetical protein